MRIVRTVAAMQRLAAQWKRGGSRIGFVPTMGYLHDGHVSLVHAARRRVGASGRVVLSIYVNPTQFAPHEDLARYPRDFRGDCRRCRDAGVDVVFAPDDGAMYPGRGEGRYTTYVVEEGLTRTMEGAARPTHFRGVTTIVAKLFNAVLPDVAVFGAKDWQQAAVIRRMAANLDFPLRMIVAPTVREPDGLAMSSRNRYLSPPERHQAVALSEALRDARTAVRERGAVRASVLSGRVRRRLSGCPDARLEYVAFFDPETLEPVATVKPGHRMALAVYVGRTRLIDNAGL